MEVTREEWLQAAIAMARPHFINIGQPLPERIRVAVGFTSAGSRGKRIGECWSDTTSADGTFEIFIVPTIDDSAKVLEILTHELVHTAVGIDAGHGPEFKKAALAIGLKGKMTATVAGDGWFKWALPVLSELGPIPHARIEGGTHTGPKKQKTALLKASCTDDACGAVIRITRKWVDVAQGKLYCPVCQGEHPMAVEGGEED